MNKFYILIDFDEQASKNYLFVDSDGTELDLVTHDLSTVAIYWTMAINNSEAGSFAVRPSQSPQMRITTCRPCMLDP